MNRKISKECLAKIEAYFKKRAEESNGEQFNETSIDIAKESGVVLATAVKGIKVLVNQRKLTVIKDNTSSRRYPNGYIYNEEGNFSDQMDKDELIKWQQQRIVELEDVLRKYRVN